MFTQYKIDVPNPNTTIIWTPTFEWYVTSKSGSKNGHKKDTCSNEIGLHAQNMVIIISSTVKHDWGRATYMNTH